MSYSASAVYAMKTFGDAFHFLKRQLLWFAIGFVFMFVFKEIDYRNYLKYTKLMLLVSLVLLVLVLLPGIGHSAKGSARWLGIGAGDVPALGVREDLRGHFPGQGLFLRGGGPLRPDTHPGHHRIGHFPAGHAPARFRDRHGHPAGVGVYPVRVRVSR